ncbi:heme-dependent oxidative N-demethylase subunit alpha family protein [Lacunisphaera limnophila]|nr:heme-dependent oxidative N-demethylase subunit alpha family protein [Lacunisphaera limnophila]
MASKEAMPLSLPELFPDQDYRFHLTLRKGDLAGFFRQPDPVVLAERQRWFGEDPGRYVVGEADAEPLVAEAEALATGWVGGAATPAGDVTRRLARLGGRLEPDLVLMAREADGVFRLRAGAVCFPSAWVPAEKHGLTLDEIHGVVPGLNPALAPAIGQFLQRLRPGAPYERANWGLAATPELNLHPALGRPRLSAGLGPAQLWVRIEDQILAALPVTGGILFGIRVRVVELAQLLAEPALRAGLHRALVTMPSELAAYKGLVSVRDELIRMSRG